MWGMFIKDLREYGRWAVLLGLALGVGLAAALIGNRPTMIVSETYLSILIAAFFGTGIVAGLAVMLGDLRRGHYAFAVVRPVPRWRLFLSKFLAASTLYGVATTLALAIVTVVATRSRLTRAPFDIAMLVPSLYFQLAGLAWVAGGMLIAARRAWWFGSRIYPLVLPAAMALAGGVYFDSVVSASALALATAAVLLAVGVAYFNAGGEHRRLAGWARPLAGLCVLGGVAAVVGGGFGAAGEMLTSAAGGRPPYIDLRQEYYLIGDDGRPVRYVRDGGNRQYFDLAGHEVSTPEWTRTDHDDVGAPRATTQPVASTGALRQNGQLSAVDVRDPKSSFYYRHRRFSFLSVENYATAAWNDDRDGWQWHYVTPRRAFEAYDPDGNYVGCLGPDGTFDTTGRTLPFPAGTRLLVGNGRVASGVLLFNDTTAYLVSPGSRRVETVFRSTPDEPILDLTLLYTSADGTWQRTTAKMPASQWDPWLVTRVAATTPGKLHVRNLDGTQPMTLPLPSKEPMPYVNFTAFIRRGPQTPDVAMMTDVWGRNDGGQLITLRNGVVTRETLPAIDERPWTPSRRLWTESVPMAAMPPAAISLFVYRVMTAPNINWPDKFASLSVVPRSWHDFFFLGGAIVGLIATALLARRYRLGRSATLTWLGLALLLGLHVPFTLVCLRERPAKAKCPACGKPRPLGETTCPHCQAPWPVPGDPATDVIEPARAA